ncbi:MAG: DUF2147 domain-containing protein [Alphaproteobacteria bacterium]
MKKLFFALLLISLLAGSSSAYAKRLYADASKPKDPVSGFWYTQDHDGVIQLYRCDGKICGRFYWLKSSSHENVSLDINNPDPDKKSRGLCKLQFMGDFEADGLGHYSDGWIYSPRHGQTFSAEMTLLDKNTLSLRGYVLTPLLGEEQIWKRTTKTPSCKENS